MKRHLLKLAQSGGSVAYVIKVKTIVNHVSSGCGLSQMKLMTGKAAAVPDLWLWAVVDVLAIGLTGTIFIRKRCNGKA